MRRSPRSTLSPALLLLLAASALPQTGCLLPDSRTTSRWVDPNAHDASPDTGGTGGVVADARHADGALQTDALGTDAGPTTDAGPATDAAPPFPDALVEPDLGPPVTRPADCAGTAQGAFTHAGGGSLTATDANGAFVGAGVEIPADALDADVNLTLGCADSIVRAGYVPLGPAVRVTPDHVVHLGRNARVTLVFSAPDKPAQIEERHLRLFWKPDNFNYVAEPPALDVRVDVRAGVFSFVTPAFGTFQLGYGDHDGEMVDRKFTYRAIAGVSMGSGAAAYLGTKYHDLFDYIVPLGGLTDQPYLMHYMHDRLMAGFCAVGQGDGVGSFCGLPDPSIAGEHPSNYLYWYYDSSEGGGGGFDRDEYISIFQDLSYAYGNPLLYNPESPYLPPGTPSSDLRIPSAIRCSAECVGDNCQVTPPRTLPAGTFYDDEYNPHAEYPVIAYCDGEDGAPEGVLSGQVPNHAPIEVAYAVDVNGNGKRDLNEPVIRDMWEPFDDVGCDGMASADEPGYDPETNPDPHSDDYDWYRNPNGTEGNWLYDNCGAGLAEPYQDVGLDGVAGTPQFADGGYDYGEGNGQFDYNPNVATYLARNPGTLFQALPAEERERLRYWADGGIRDIFNFAIDTGHMAGRLQAAGQNVHVYDDFPQLFQDGSDSSSAFFPSLQHRDAFGKRGQSIFVRYGNPDADEFDISQGDGAHVGTVIQALNRFMTFFEWIHNRWPGGDYRPIYGAFQREDGVVFIDSAHFGKRYRFGISLPPGYGDPANADERYPVLLVLHGYGMGPEDLPITGSILASQMASGAWQKSIVLFPEGFCGKATKFQCNDGIDNDGDGQVDSTAEGALRHECQANTDCVGTYSCRNGWCCPAYLTECGPPDSDCGNNPEGHSEGGANTLCSDGVDNDLDGRTDLEDQGCLDDATQDSEADCKKGAFYTDHVAAKDGTPGGPDFEGAMVDMLDYLDTHYRTKRPEILSVPR